MDIVAVHPNRRNVLHRVNKASFSFYSPETIRKISVCQITCPVAFDSLHRPVPGGLYDPALGVLDHSVTKLCTTCHLGYSECPGHFGRIELSLPVVNPVLFPLLIKILRAKCWYCHHFRWNERAKKLCLAKLRFLHSGDWMKAEQVEEILQSVNNAEEQRRRAVEEENAIEEEKKTDVLESNLSLFEAYAQLEDKIDKQQKQLQERLFEEAYQRWQQRSNKSNLQSTAPISFSWRKKSMEEFLMSNEMLSKCQHCGQAAVGIRREDAKVFRFQTSRSKDAHQSVVPLLVGQSIEKEEGNSMTTEEGMATKGSKQLVSTLEMEEQLKALCEIESELVQLLWQVYPMRDESSYSSCCLESMFFIRCLAVPPSRFRPPASFSEGEQLTMMEHPQNVFLTRILHINQQLASRKESTNQSSVLYAIQQMIALQQVVNQLYDCSRGGMSSSTAMTGIGIRQQLEHKEGLFRMHMMGKRVNHSARSVISPDPFLETCEIGVPESFAKKLTFPEPITNLNIETMRQVVIRGANEYFGANGIEDKMGNVIDLKRAPKHQRTAQAWSFMPLNEKVAENKDSFSSKSSWTNNHWQPFIRRVYRHMRNGDMVLFNRQPSLHRVSILAHRVRVLPGERTIRMHYANCQSYNADFDGDEMNLHFPQDWCSQAEAKHLVWTDGHYISPTNGHPLRGLIQDHIIGGVLLTSLDTFLTREQFQQLLYGALERTLERNDIQRQHHTLKLPMPCILSPTPLWTGKQLISTILLFLIGNRFRFYLYGQGKLKTEMIGEDAHIIIRQGELLQGVLDKSQFGASAYGLVHAFYEIYGAEDAGRLLSALGSIVHFISKDTWPYFRKELLSQLQMPMTLLVTQHFIEELGERGALNEKDLSCLLRKDWKALLPNGKLNYSELLLLYGRILGNTTEMMILSRNQMESLLDDWMKRQVSKITSQVIQSCVSDKNGLLKKFPNNGFLLMTSSGAKGSLVNSSQISCQLGQTELEGKRVPRSSSGATLPCYASFDPSPRAGGFIMGRFLTGIRPDEYFYHCMAGRDGLVDTAVKTARSGYLQRCLVKGLEDLYVGYDYSVRESENQGVIQFLYGDDGMDPCHTAWLLKESCLEWHLWNSQAFYSWERRKKTPKRKFVSPKFQEMIHRYINQYNSSSHESTKSLDLSIFETMMRQRYERSIISPGEAVGILAAQGIGEPSTQMTLNTFHFAGMGAAHVTLGIPRLRELKGTDKSDNTRFHRIVLKDFLQGITIEDQGSTAQGRCVMIQLHLISPDTYEPYLRLSRKEMFQIIETQFLARLYAVIQRECKRILESKIGVFRLNGSFVSSIAETDGELKQDEETTQVEKKKGSHASLGKSSIDQTTMEEEADEEDDKLSWNEEDGASGEKREKQQRESNLYEEEDEEDEEEGEEKTFSSKQKIHSQEDMQVGAHQKRETNKEENITKRKMEMDCMNYRWVRIPLILPHDAWGRLMLLEVVESVALNTFIQSVSGVESSRVVVAEAPDTRYLEVKGSNLGAIWELGYDTLDIDRLRTNDVYAMLTNYGVESARATLLLELSKVFEAYGIPVDPRHLGLIADVMTHQGTYQPFNRQGIEERTGSVFQKASFETTMKFLSDAAITKQQDSIQSPSSRLAVGRSIGYGTGEGIFSLRQRV
eukprot:jgi/Galph1/3787/GphlegSOOS_G2499.1